MNGNVAENHYATRTENPCITKGFCIIGNVVDLYLYKGAAVRKSVLALRRNRRAAVTVGRSVRVHIQPIA